MVRVITYGTFDLLHYGHVRLLERAKALGDYLIVGVTADDFDKTRGKINVKQSLAERLEAVRKTGLADKIIVEEYEGQKIDDIKRFSVDIFTVGSDWVGTFDYLKQYCKVVYLDRTEGISSTELRSNQNILNIGLVGYSPYLNKVAGECRYVNGLIPYGVYTDDTEEFDETVRKLPLITDNYSELLKQVDAVFIHSHPSLHYEQCKLALLEGKHVMCISPIALRTEECAELFEIAESRNLILMDALKTVFSTAYARLILLIRSGKIGAVKSVDAVCTSLTTLQNINQPSKSWGSMTAWGPTALLPVFQILGTDYERKEIISFCKEDDRNLDLFTKIDFVYPDAVASIRVGTGVKSEGELIISGTKGYAFVPAPWWKTDYFEIRYENPLNNRRYFYQLDGEGIRNGLVEFLRAINGDSKKPRIDRKVTMEIVKTTEDYYRRSKKNSLTM